jgi:hypothetical protein|tara:strand:- start:1539 stop:1811 length:273 start_codon:yes stop_codon:yes gene_type:complete
MGGDQSHNKPSLSQSITALKFSKKSTILSKLEEGQYFKWSLGIGLLISKSFSSCRVKFFNKANEDWEGNVRYKNVTEHVGPDMVVRKEIK